MKKNLLFIFLIGILSNNSLYAQNNYLNEAKYISEVIKNQPTNIRISLDIRTNTFKTSSTEDDIAFYELIDTLNKSIKKKTRQKNVIPPPKDSGGAPTGPVGQPAANDKKGKANDENKNANVEIDLFNNPTIRNELMAILYLKQANNIADLNTVINVMPVEFGAINDEGIIKAIGNAEGNSTGFAFNETEIIYGILDFTISRAKEQLVETYLSAWYNKLNSDEIVKEMIPQTLGTLKAFNDDQSLSMTKFGDTWKMAFQEDLRNIPTLLQNEKYIEKLLVKGAISNDQKNQILPLITGSSKLVYDLYLKKHLFNIVSDMSTNYSLNTENDPAFFRRMIVLTDILLKAGGNLKNNETYEPVSLEDLKKMDIEAWTIFVKLLYIRHNKEFEYIFKKNTSTVLNNLINNNNEQINDFAKLFKQTIGLISSYQSMVNKGQNQIESKLNFEDSRKLFDLSFQLTEQSVNMLSYFLKINQISVPNLDTFKKATPYYKSISEIAEGVSNKQYGAVVNGTLGIIRMIDTQNKMADVINNLQIYGSFMVNIINADDADKVKAALEELIPKNLYQLKNTHQFSMSLSAYPGVFGGREQVTQTNSVGTSISPFLPIGLDFSFGNKRVKDSNNYFSSTNFFFQFLDFGAVMNYRLNNEKNEEANPNVTFKQLFSPGFTVMRHLRNSPVVIGGGVNYTPSLRTVNTNGNETKENAWRVGLFCAVDVTFFHLFNSKKTLK